MTPEHTLTPPSHHPLSSSDRPLAFIKVIVERVSRDLFKLANFMFALFVEFVFLFLFQFLFRFVLFCFWVSFRQRFCAQCRVSLSLRLSLSHIMPISLSVLHSVGDACVVAT